MGTSPKTTIEQWAIRTGRRPPLKRAEEWDAEEHRKARDARDEASFIEIQVLKPGEGHRVRLDEPLPPGVGERVRLIILIGEDEPSDDEWLRAVTQGGAFDFLNAPEEDRYALRDGGPFDDAREGRPSNVNLRILEAAAP